MMEIQVCLRDEGRPYPWLLMVDGLVRRVGTEAECKMLGQILQAGAASDREFQNRALQSLV